MKTCSGCGEINGDANTKCFRCGADIGVTKYCNHCSKAFTCASDVCPECKHYLCDLDKGHYTMPPSDENSTLLYLLCILFPPIGIIGYFFERKYANKTSARNLGLIAWGALIFRTVLRRLLARR